LKADPSATPDGLQVFISVTMVYHPTTASPRIHADFTARPFGLDLPPGKVFVGAERGDRCRM